jgi:predicted TIM-barrel fold metal-dependent hydrolase
MMNISSKRNISVAAFLCLVLTASAQTQPSPQSEEKLAELISLEPIDTHVHVFQTDTVFIGMLERLHMHVLDILVVDDSNPYRTAPEPQKQDALKFVAASAGHAYLCTTFDPYRFNNPDFAKAAIEALNQDFARGAIAVKIWKNVGMELKNASGQYVLPDDPRLEHIYKDIAEHHKTLVAHLAEPDVAWGASDPKAPYAGYYRSNPQWDMSKRPDVPRKRAIIDARNHLLAMNPDLVVVGAHLGSMEGDLDQIAACFGQYPNFVVDTAARLASLAVQSREKVLAFFLKFQDRILYGTDLGFYSGRTGQVAAHEWENRYALDWRYFATDDDFEYQGRPVKGLKLPREVLKKLYHDNAVHWIPGIAARH